MHNNNSLRRKAAGSLLRFKYLQKFICFALVLISCSCNLIRSESFLTKTTDVVSPVPRPSPSVSPRDKIYYTVPGHVPVIKQPDRMSCWATVATMLASWKDNKQHEIEETLERAGPKYLQIFRAGRGLEASDKNAFLRAMRLRSEAPQSFTVKGWLSLLQTYGPLWVTTQLRRDNPEEEKFSVHARVLIGIYEEGRDNELFVKIIDPETGTQYDEKFADFFRRFENIAREDLEMETEFQPQVIHF